MSQGEGREMSSLKRALITVSKLEARLDAVERARTEPLAVVGIGCRFPGGAADPDTFWRLLRDGVDAVKEIPAERGLIDPSVLGGAPGAPELRGTRWAGLLDDVEGFEPEFFGIAPREAVQMDPQQRLILEVAWEAIESSGQAPGGLLGGRAGVFLGKIASDYRDLVTAGGLDAIEPLASTGTVGAFLAGRLSYVLGLHGPAVVVETACSSSLVAVDLACRSLRDGECDLAIAGAASLMHSPISMHMTAQTQSLSPEGRCKAFDAGANGWVRGEGCGLVVLMRLSDALREGAPIWALLRSSVTNHDGRTSGLAAPNVLLQQALIQRALELARVSPADIGYLEAHGSGTPLGDPIEFEAIRSALGAARADGSACVLGSVKTNLGHTEAAAGVAGLIKAVLALHHEAIPPNLHFRTLNPRMSMDGTPFMIPTRLMPWPRGEKPRFAGVNSFGISGTNAHVVLEEAPRRPAPEGGPERPHDLLVLSGGGRAILEAQALRYAQHLEDHPEQRLGDVCHTARAGRTHAAERLSIVAGSRAALVGELRAFAAGAEDLPLSTVGRARPAGRKLAFLFTGQGSQYAGMGRGLYDTEPVFREVIDRCDALLDGALERPLRAVLYPAEGEPSPIDETLYTHPAVFALECALSALWRSWGVVPDLVLGHSLGEYAAACAAGVFGLEDGLRLVVTRGRLLQGLPAGGLMGSIQAEPERVEALIASSGGRVSLAACNAPQQVVISGGRDDVRRILEAMTAEGVKTQELAISFAAHSPGVEPILDAFEQAAAAISMARPRVALVSNVTGGVIGDEVATPGYWRRHIREPVRFSAGMEALAAAGAERFVEIGPHTTLVGMGAACLQRDGLLWLPSLRRRHDDARRLLETAGALHVDGVAIDWAAFDRPFGHRRVPVPTTVWARRRLWLEAPAPRERVEASPLKGAPRPLLGRRLDTAGSEILFEARVGLASLPFLGDHRVFGQAVMPAAGLLEPALAAARELFGEGAHAVEAFSIDQPLLLPEDAPVRIQLVARPRRGGDLEIEIFARDDRPGDAGAWTRHGGGLLRRGARGQVGGAAAGDLERIRARCADELSVEAFYRSLAERGLGYGPRFQGIRRLWRGEAEALGQIALPAPLYGEAAAFQIHPALLDAALQVLASLLRDDDPSAYMPVRVAQLRVLTPGVKAAWVHAATRAPGPAERGAAVLDLALFDASGAEIATLEGLAIERARPEALRPAGELDGCLFLRTFRPQPLRGAGGDAPGRWLIFADRGGLGDRLAARLEAAGASCARVVAGAGPAIVAGEGPVGDRGLRALDPADPDACRRLLAELRHGGPPLRGVVYLWGLDAPTPGDRTDRLEASVDQVCRGALHLIQTLAEGPAPARLALVTRGAQAVGDPRGERSVAQAPLWGLGQVAAIEHPELRCLLVDLGGGEREAEELANELTADDVEGQVGYRDGARRVARVVRVPPARSRSRPRIAADASYLVTGGLGALGLRVAGWLVERGAGQVVLLGRGAPSPAARAQIDELAARGARIEVAAADVSRQDEVAAVLADLAARLPPLRGVIHCAAVLDDGLLADQRWSRFATVMAPKVSGAWSLHVALGDRPLDLFVLFSSAASLVGSPGQANYAAANAFLDALAHHRRGLDLPALSINWGAFGQVGRLARSERAVQNVTSRGLVSMTPDEGIALLERCLGLDEPQLGALRVDWRVLLERQFAAGPPPHLADLAREEGPAAADAEPTGALAQRLRDASPIERRGLLLDQLRAALARVLGASRDALREDRGFAEMGMDSLMSIDLRNRLQRALGAPLPASLVMDHPNLDRLADFLLGEVLALDEGAGAEPARRAGGEDRAPDPAVGDMDALSVNDLEALLAAEIQAAGSGQSGGGK